MLSVLSVELYLDPNNQNLKGAITQNLYDYFFIIISDCFKYTIIPMSPKDRP